MEMSLSARRGPIRKHWERTGALLLTLAVVVLLVTVLVPRASSGPLAFLLPVTVLIALCTVLVFHARFMLLARREQRETTTVLKATEREFESIFDGALDAILIFDDQTICLEANPAALALFGMKRNEIVGNSIRKGRSNGNNIDSVWEPHLATGHQDGEVHLAGQNGSDVFAEYTVKANYLPGRHVAILRDISAKKKAEAALRDSDERFRQMAGCIREIYWLLDAETKHLIYVNGAYETLTGRSLASLRDDPTSYQEAFHPEDRATFLKRLDEATQTGELDEEFRIIRPDLVVRWVSVRGFPVRDSAGVIRKLVGISQDISARKSAEEQMAKSLIATESARAEADAFRKITLALTQNLRMDCVLDTLLESLRKIIPCDSARVFLVEADTRLFLERELQCSDAGRHTPKCPDTLDAAGTDFLMRVLTTKNSLLISDTAQEPQWSGFRGHTHLLSWLCVPLVAGQQVLGLLSIGDTHACTFTQEHLRLAKSLAIPAAVAIQNARLYERSEIYSVELEQCRAELIRTNQALQQVRHRSALSDKRFTKVFRSSPIALSITSIDEGCFMEVNAAFQARSGYTRQELLNRAVVDIAFWDSPSERSVLLDEVRRVGHVRNRSTRFRNRLGQILRTVYSADVIEFGGQQCILAVSEDVPDRVAGKGTQTRPTRGAW
jgi:PAS domain S-box-containing protein